MENKGTVIGNLTPEQLTKFRAWQQKHASHEQASRMLVKSAMAAINDGSAALVKENTELWSEVEKTLGLNPKQHFHIDYDTGEVIAPPKTQPSGLALILGGGGDGCGHELGDGAGTNKTVN